MLPKNWFSEKSRPISLGIAVYIILILSVTVYAIDAWNQGYRVPQDDSSVNVYVGNALGTASSGVRYTVTNRNPTNDYFIPTRTQAEWDAFIANPPSEIYICDYGFADCDWDRNCECDLSTHSCSGTSCVEDCYDLCSLGQTRCLDLYNEQNCGDCDGDPCLEWCSITPCGSDYCEGNWGSFTCDVSSPVPRRVQYQTCHDRGCSSGACFDITYPGERGDYCQDNTCVEPYCSGGYCDETNVPYGGNDEACTAGGFGCPGSSCMCDGNRQCCVSNMGASCGGSVCMNPGTTQCDGSCVGATPVADETYCGVNQVCFGGACVYGNQVDCCCAGVGHTSAYCNTGDGWADCCAWYPSCSGSWLNADFDTGTDICCGDSDCGPNSDCSSPIEGTCSCTGNYADCNGDGSGSDTDGCEVYLLEDADNCGSCGNACNAGTLVGDDYCVEYGGTWYVRHYEETGTCSGGSCDVESVYVDTCTATEECIDGACEPLCYWQPIEQTCVVCGTPSTSTNCPMNMGVPCTCGNFCVRLTSESCGFSGLCYQFTFECLPAI